MTKLKSLKKHQIFLFIALSLFFLSIIVIAIILFKDNMHHQEEIQHITDPLILTVDKTTRNAIIIFIILPFFAVELTWIRSVYKLLKYNIKGFTKICYIFSASIAFLTIAFFWLNIAGYIHLERIINDVNITAIVLLIAEFPVNLFSFILGSLPVKTKAKEKDIQ